MGLERVVAFFLMRRCTCKH